MHLGILGGMENRIRADFLQQKQRAANVTIKTLPEVDVSNLDLSKEADLELLNQQHAAAESLFMQMLVEQSNLIAEFRQYLEIEIQDGVVFARKLQLREKFREMLPLPDWLLPKSLQKKLASMS